MSQVTVVALIKSKPQYTTETRESLLALIKPTKEDKGMINYDLHESLDEPGLFVFHENWQSRELLDEHLAKPHIQNWISLTKDWLDLFEVKVLRYLDGSTATAS